MIFGVIIWQTVTPGGRGGVGGTLIFSYIRNVGGGNFVGFKYFEFHYFGGFSGKMNIFWGMKILWIFLGVITKLDYIKGSLLCILGFFFKVKVQNWGYFWGLLKFQIFFGGA